MKAKSVDSCHEVVKSLLWTLFVLCMTPFSTLIGVSLALYYLECKYWSLILQKYWSEEGSVASLCIKDDGLTWQHKGLLVWTSCLMHKCVCIWRYILQNYNYKLHFQNLSIYHIPHVFIGTLTVENLDVCITCDSWNNNIQLTMVKDQRWQIYPNVVWRIYVGFVTDIDINILGVPPLGRACLS
jgi:hypothetical protein